MSAEVSREALEPCLCKSKAEDSPTVSEQKQTKLCLPSTRCQAIAKQVCQKKVGHHPEGQAGVGHQHGHVQFSKDK